MENNDRRGVLRGLVALPLIGGGVVSVASAAIGQDAELLALGRQFEAAWAVEAEQWQAVPKHKVSAEDDRLKWQAACDAADRTSAIVDQIEQLTATTIAGVMVKVRVCFWTHSGEPFDDDFFGEGRTTDQRMAAGVLRDLLAIGNSQSI